MRTIKPEAYYTMDYGVTTAFVMDAYKNNRTVTGMVTRIDVEKRRLIVCLGESVYAELPWKEATIYSLEGKTKHGEVPEPIHALRYRKIRAKVKAFDNGTIILSRKENMLEAWRTIVDDKTSSTYSASVIGYHCSGVFYDIGEGLCAFCYINEYSLCRFDIKSWITFNERSTVKIIGEPRAESDYKISCSRKRGSQLTYYDFRVGEIVMVRVSTPVRNGKGEITGFFVELAPNVSGIADVYKKTRLVHNGDYVRAVINRIDTPNKKMHLSMIEQA